MKLIIKVHLIMLMMFAGTTCLYSADGQGALKKMWGGDYRGAVNEARQVLKNNNKDLSAWRALTGGLYRLRNYNELIRLVPVAIKGYQINLNNKSGHAYMILKYLGAACLNNGQSKKAIVAFGVAAKLKSDDPDLYNSLGLAYLLITMR